MGLRLELARVGLWGSTENATPLTAEDLKEVAETVSKQSYSLIQA